MIKSELSVVRIEREIQEIWGGIFGVEVGREDNFFDLGGDSLKVVDVVIEAKRRGLSFRSSAVFRNPTPAALAASLSS